MQEKDMVLDIINGTKASTSSYTKAIAEGSNVNLINMLTQMRSADEKFHYELFKIAKSKNYYIPAKQATQAEILELKQNLVHSSTMQQGGGPIPNIR